MGERKETSEKLQFIHLLKPIPEKDLNIGTVGYVRAWFGLSCLVRFLGDRQIETILKPGEFEIAFYPDCEQLDASIGRIISGLNQVIVALNTIYPSYFERLLAESPRKKCDIVKKMPKRRTKKAKQVAA